jgi:putative ABC transport system substrate-binding protein
MILVAGTTASPVATRAQQPAMPVIGFLAIGAPDDFTEFVAAFRQSLHEMGINAGRNVSIEFRWAAGHYDRLPALIDELIKHDPAILVAGGPPAATALKAATSSIPIVFIAGEAAALGLVDSLSRPGGNLTGVSIFTTPEMWGKRLQLLHELMPKATRVAAFLSPNRRRETNHGACAALYSVSGSRR